MTAAQQQSTSKIHELIIVGSGPAGYTAGVYLSLIHI